MDSGLQRLRQEHYCERECHSGECGSSQPRLSFSTMQRAELKKANPGVGKILTVGVTAGIPVPKHGFGDCLGLSNPGSDFAM